MPFSNNLGIKSSINHYLCFPLYSFRRLRTFKFICPIFLLFDSELFIYRGNIAYIIPVGAGAYFGAFAF